MKLHEKTQCDSGLYIANMLKVARPLEIDFILKDECVTSSSCKNSYPESHLVNHPKLTTPFIVHIQVLSKSVAHAFSTVRDLEPEDQFWEETANVWPFQDTRNLDEAKLKCKPDLRAYFKPDDSTVLPA